jgi:leucyl-tRNA synthetase
MNTIAIQVNGSMTGTVEAPPDAEMQTVFLLAMVNDDIAPVVEKAGAVLRTPYVPNRLMNIITAESARP